MPDNSPRLALPFLLPSQAQKHVTHNEALARLDALVQLTAQALDAETPPAAPAAGQVFGLGPDPVGDWAGQGGRLAVWDGVAWGFVTPAEGWRAFDLTAGRLMAYSGGTWAPVAGAPQNLDGVGIGTASDPVNRLALAAEAALFSHAGGDHRLKVNKAAAGDTASLLFQSGWTGHAEMGLAGDTAFSVKVSADGLSWSEAMRADPGAQAVSWAPAGSVRMVLADSALQLDVPLTGTAAQASATDSTPGRVMKVGAFGLGADGTPPALADLDVADTAIGFWHVPGTAAGTRPALLSGVNCYSLITRGAGTQLTQIMWREGNAIAGGVWMRACSSSIWGTWVQIAAAGGLVGTVGESGGIPTGAIIEKGANGNGWYTRFADGTQICGGKPLIKAAADTTSGIKSATWTFPAAFAGAADLVVSATVLSTVPQSRGQSTAGAPTTTDVVLSYYESASYAFDVKMHALAVGRWF